MDNVTVKGKFLLNSENWHVGEFLGEQTLYEFVSEQFDALLQSFADNGTESFIFLRDDTFDVVVAFGGSDESPQLEITFEELFCFFLDNEYTEKHEYLKAAEKLRALASRIEKTGHEAEARINALTKR